MKFLCNGRDGKNFGECPILMNGACDIVSIIDANDNLEVLLYSPDPKKAGECKAKNIAKPTKELMESASSLMAIYSSLIEVGFNADQALAILCSFNSNINSR